MQRNGFYVAASPKWGIVLPNNSENGAVRTRIGFAAGLFGILTNFAAFLIKITVGLISGSVTVAADAVNSLTDAGSSILTMIGFRLAAKPADSDHPFGHARYEQITALIISLVMFAVGVLFAKSSVEKIITPEELSIDIFTYSALAAAIFLKAVQAAVNFYFSKKIDSQTLAAAALDSRNDVLITSSVLLSVIVMGVSGINIDGWAGLAVSLFIIWSSAVMIKKAVSPMLGMKPPESLVNAISDIVKSRPEVRGFHDLQIHNYGFGANFASLHAEVDPKSDIVAIHKVIDGIEQEVKTKLGVLLTIHMDPVGAGGEDEDEKDKD